MDDPVHGRHAAIYATAKKRLPPSFFLGLGFAVAIHIGFAYYLLQHNFARAVVEELPPPERVLPIDILPAKPKPQPDQTVVKVHDPVLDPTDKTDIIPVPPQDPTLTQGETKTPPDLSQTKVDPGPQTGTKVEPDPYVTARWTRFPDADALTNYYPPRAMEDEVEGTATVQCVVLDTAGRVSCVVVSEKPGGYGFGAATVRMVQDKGRVDTTQGNVQVGSMLRQTVAWRLN